ncbi:MAG: hypothetical protein KA100_00925 [Rickettsiales bacterium]|nr:hypothetical protein [Rickettsiales bacterium]
MPENNEVRQDKRASMIQGAVGAVALSGTIFGLVGWGMSGALAVNPAPLIAVSALLGSSAALVASVVTIRETSRSTRQGRGLDAVIRQPQVELGQTASRYSVNDVVPFNEEEIQRSSPFDENDRASPGKQISSISSIRLDGYRGQNREIV